MEIKHTSISSNNDRAVRTVEKVGYCYFRRAIVKETFRLEDVSSIAVSGVYKKNFFFFFLIFSFSKFPPPSSQLSRSVRSVRAPMYSTIDGRDNGRADRVYANGKLQSAKCFLLRAGRERALARCLEATCRHPSRSPRKRPCMQSSPWGHAYSTWVRDQTNRKNRVKTRLRTPNGLAKACCSRVPRGRDQSPDGRVWIRALSLRWGGGWA
jgi:hypothetical protein